MTFQLKSAQIVEIIPPTIEGGITQVIGTFVFDGRLASNQNGDFRYSYGPGMDKLTATPALDFTINYKGRYGWHKRKMKESGQKMSLTHDLTKHIKMGLEIVDQTTETEYGVDTEREMAASEQTLDNAALAAVSYTHLRAHET